MSDSVTKPRPRIDLEELEKGLRKLRSSNQKHVEPLAELLHVIGGQDESHKIDFDSKLRHSPKITQDAGQPEERKQSHARDGIISGDFAAIEAGLLGTQRLQVAFRPDVETSDAEHQKPIAPVVGGNFNVIEVGSWRASREQATIISSDAAMPSGFPKVDLGSERWLHQDNAAVSRNGGVADKQTKSRRHPLYVFAAIVVAGIAGIASSFAFRGDVSGPPEFATIEVENKPAVLQADTTSGAEVPAQDVAMLSASPAPSADVNGSEQIFGLAQTEEIQPPIVAPVESQASLDSELAAVPTAPAESQSQSPGEAVSIAPPIAQEEIKADLAQPDGALLPNGTPLPKDPPPQVNAHEAPPPAPHPAATAKARTVKPVARVAKTPKPAAAKQTAGRAQPRQIANKSEVAPASPPSPEPTPSAVQKAEAPAPQPSPPSNGAFGLVQSAVNSLTSTTSKLLQWGKIETGIR